MAQLLKGLSAANALTETLAMRAAALNKKSITPTLAILRVGERSDDISYESGAIKRCAKVGIAVRQFLLSAGCTQAELLSVVRQINEDPSIHGCLMFRPLPDKTMEEAACSLLSPEKDVDGMTPGSLTGIFTGTHVGFAPCTSEACVKILEHYGVAMAGKRAAVLGRSMTVGKPAAMLLLEKNATVTLCHSKSEELDKVCREAEILVVGIGKANAIGREHIREGAYIVDAGISVMDGAFVGDVEEAAAAEKAAAYAPVSDGVGAVTVSLLMGHTVEAARRSGK